MGEIIARVRANAATSAIITFGGLEILVGALGAPETAGLSLELVLAGATEAAIAGGFLVAGVVGVGDGINRLQGKGFGEQ